MHLVEPAPIDGSDPLDNFRTIREELRLYDPRLAERGKSSASPSANLPSRRRSPALDAEVGAPVLRISAVTGQGLPELVSTISRELAAQEADNPEPFLLSGGMRRGKNAAETNAKSEIDGPV